MTARSPSAEAAHHSKRHDVEALRALAVVLVLLLHAFPTVLPGGFVGVDVFFVISGFLIITQIVNERAESGRVALRRFYVRRAWRLLPLAYFVLLVTLVATAAWVPETVWRSTAKEAVASGLYVQNWLLVAQSVDYTAADTGASAVQHYWSLSIEEQFYVAIPLLIVVGTLGVQRSRVRKIAVWGLACITALSLGFSIGWAPAVDGQAYFSTLTRVWEFGLGGLLGVAGWRLRGAIGSAGVVVGIALIVASARLIDGVQGFPGAMALIPVGGALLVLAGGTQATDFVKKMLGLSVVQRLGGVSYGLYLWHWPVLVILPFALGQEASAWTSTLALVIAVALAVASRPFEERLRSLGRRPAGAWKAAVAGGVVGVLSVTFGGYALINQIPSSTDTTKDVTVAQDDLGSCFGAAALVNLDDCKEGSSSKVVPDPSTVSSNNPEERCKEGVGGREVRTCTFGPEGGTDVALVGDSHAQRLLPALKSLAEKHNWRLTTYLKGSCPFSAVAPVKYQSSCVEWNASVMERLKKNRPQYLLSMSSAGLSYQKEAGETDAQAGARGAAEHFKTLEAAGVQVVPVVDNPQPGFARIDPPACVLQKGAGECTFEAKAALRPDSAREAAQLAGDVPVLDLTDLFCRDGQCPSVVGGVLVYRDGQHVIDVYAESMSPYIYQRLVEAEGGLQ